VAAHRCPSKAPGTAHQNVQTHSPSPLATSCCSGIAQGCCQLRFKNRELVLMRPTVTRHDVIEASPEYSDRSPQMMRLVTDLAYQFGLLSCGAVDRASRSGEALGVRSSALPAPVTDHPNSAGAVLRASSPTPPFLAGHSTSPLRHSRPGTSRHEDSNALYEIRPRLARGYRIPPCGGEVARTSLRSGSTATAGLHRPVEQRAVASWKCSITPVVPQIAASMPHSMDVDRLRQLRSRRSPLPGSLHRPCVRSTFS